VIRLPAEYSSRAATLEDLDAIVEVFAAWERLHLDELVMSRTNLEDDWSHGWFDRARDTVLVETGDTAVGYASCGTHDVSHPFDAWGAVHPEHEGRGLGTALIGWAEDRARRDLRDGSSARLWNGTNGRNKPGLLLFRNLGYEAVRTFAHMATAVPARASIEASPDGVEVRVCRGDADERGLWESLQDAFSTHFGFYPQPIEEWWAEQRAYPTFDPELMLVAVDADEVVGGVAAYVEGGIGWIGEVGVRTTRQRQGVGRTLLLHALAVFADRGLSHMRLNVDLDNATRASDLYRSIGMDVVQEWRIFEKSITRD
jgi:mycothiol synthase